MLLVIIQGIGRYGGGHYGGGHYGGRRYGGGRYGGASQKGVDATAEPPESSYSHYYGRYGGQTWAPPKMLQRRREAVFHSAAAAYRRLEPIFWQHNHCTTD